MAVGKKFLVVILAARCSLLDAARIQETMAGGFKCFAFKGTQLCKKGPVTATYGMDVTHYAKDFSVPEKMCLSKLCDTKKGGLWEQCCLIRETLVHEGDPISNFEYEGAGVIHISPPVTTAKPETLIIDNTQDTTKVQPTTCASAQRTVHFGDDFSVKFDVPESSPGPVKMKCGETAQDPEAEVEFQCGSNFKWEKDVSGYCREALYCAATKFRLSDKTEGKILHKHPDLIFSLPRQPNKFKQTVTKEVACPSNSANRKGKAKFACDADGKWSLVEQKCTRDPTQCPEQKYKVTLAGHEHTYELIAKPNGFDMPRTCLFGPFKEGHVHFLCKDGQWELGGHDCKEAEQQGGNTDKPSPVINKPSTGNSNGDANAGTCRTTDYTLTLSGHATEYNLQEGGAGAHQTVDCDNGPYTEGQIRFECQSVGSAMRWKVLKHACKKPRPKGTVCFATRYGIAGIAGPGTKITFKLDDAPVGTVDVECGEGYTGSGRFTCGSDGKWKFEQDGSKCTAA